MIYIGIDPSFVRTGVCISSETGMNSYQSFSEENLNWKIDNALEFSYQIVSALHQWLKENVTESNTEMIGVVEYPIFATRSGSYLGILTSKLDSFFRAKKITYFLVPAVAVQSYTKTNSKTDLVIWYKLNIDTSFHGNHDEATAGILAEIGKRIVDKSYKKSFIVKSYGKEIK